MGAFASHREKMRPNHHGSAMQTAVAEALFISLLYNIVCRCPICSTLARYFGVYGNIFVVGVL